MADYEAGHFEQACRKFEHAYSIWHAYLPTESKQAEDPIVKEDDFKSSELKEVSKVNELKITCLQNICVCNFKLQNWEEAIEAANGVLNLDQGNSLALFRRSKARSSLVHANLVEFRASLVDLEQVKTSSRSILRYSAVIKEINRLEGLIANTIEKTLAEKEKQIKFKTIEDQEINEELGEMNNKIVAKFLT